MSQEPEHDQTRHAVVHRPIRTLGDPVLREIARPLSELWTPKLRELVDDMLRAVHARGGVGIAAPQVGESLRLFIVASRPNERYPDAPFMQPEAIFNPEIEWASDEMIKGWEGCLSVPGLRGQVPRARRIRARCIDPDSGETVVREYADFIARVFQHELDHLNGIVFPDRVESSEDLVSEEVYRRLTLPPGDSSSRENG
ncbi:MAG TPA: peptide deformylase [Methylococcaceae bacterium]|nr:peptide deformylase [Methylococcaceae bacterium]